MGRKPTAKPPKLLADDQPKKTLRSSSSHRDLRDPATDTADIEDIFLPRFLARVEEAKANQCSYVFADASADIETLLNSRGHSIRVGPNATEYRILKAEERRLQALGVNNWSRVGTSN